MKQRTRPHPEKLRSFPLGVHASGILASGRTILQARFGLRRVPLKVVWRMQSERYRIPRHGTASRPARSRDVEQGKPQGTPLQSRSPQLASRAALLRAGIPRLPPHLRPSSNSSPDANACPGMETIVEVALISRARIFNWRFVRA